MPLIKLTETQLQTVRQYLANFGMESYLEKVAATIEGRGDGDCLLRLLHAFYQEGLARGGQLVEEAWNNILKKRVPH